MKGRSRPLGGGHDKDCVQCEHPVIQTLVESVARRNAFRAKVSNPARTRGVGSQASPARPLAPQEGRPVPALVREPVPRSSVCPAQPLPPQEGRPGAGLRETTAVPALSSVGMSGAHVLTSLTSARHSVAQHSGQQHGVQRYSSSSAQRASAHRREHRANATVVGWAP